MSLTQEQLNILKEKLLARKKELEKEINSLKREAFEEVKSDSFDEQDEYEEITNIESTENIFETELENINLALKKIDEKKYGICERCQKPISFSILEKVPESRYCRSCKLILKIFKK